MQDVANSRVCNICAYLSTQKEGYLAPTGVFICEGCQLVAYCGTTHQKLDWPLHREFCRAVQSMLKAEKCKHPMFIGGDKPPRNPAQLESATLKLKWHLRARLYRPLRYEEEEFTTYPIFCSVCYQMRQPLRTCRSCHGVSWCNEAHAQLDTYRHSKECDALRFYYSPFKALPPPATTPPVTLHTSLKLDNLELRTAFAHSTFQSPPTLAEASQSKAAFQRFATMADYSCIGTICYTLARLRHKHSQYVPQERSYSICIVGATVERMLWFKPEHTEFFFLHHDTVTELYLYFIGPELSQDAAVQQSASFEFNLQTRQVRYHSYKGTYQAFRATHANHTPPALFVIYNCGFAEYANGGSWLPGISAIIAAAVPILYTSYSADEADQDYDMLVRAAASSHNVQQLLLPHTNPYRDPRPLRSPRCTDKAKFYYRNGYVQAVVVEPPDDD